jgi:hypothetical protein
MKEWWASRLDNFMLTTEAMERSPMEIWAGITWDVPLSASFCILCPAIQAYVSQFKALVTSGGYHYKHSWEQTGGKYRQLWWVGMEHLEEDTEQ